MNGAFEYYKGSDLASDCPPAEKRSIAMPHFGQGSGRRQCRTIHSHLAGSRCCALQQQHRHVPADNFFAGGKSPLLPMSRFS
jgi:hypothetical protein